jgi:hypothetical protein
MAATATPVQINPVAFRIISYENERKMSMEDILQDPKSTWEEMMSVMRSQGHATNGGIVMALVAALEATLS